MSLSGEVHEPPLHFQAHVEGQQEIQAIGFAVRREHLGSCQESRQDGPGGVSGRVPGVIKIHGMGLPGKQRWECAGWVLRE